MSGEEAESGGGEATDASGDRGAIPSDSTRDPAPCDICGIPALIWRKCKLVCENCGSINKSCADL